MTQLAGPSEGGGTTTPVDNLDTFDAFHDISLLRFSSTKEPVMDTPHPGPAPQPLVIPEAEAAEFARAIDGLAGLLDQALRIHRQSHRNDLAAFLGPERASIDHDLERHIAGLEQDLDALDGQRRQLDGFMSDAEAAHAARHHAQRRWEQNLEQHLSEAAAQ